jgi:uncharacterized membrane protein
MANKKNRVRNLKDIEKYEIEKPKEYKVTTKHVIIMVLALLALCLIIACSLCIANTNKYSSWQKTTASMLKDSTYNTKTGEYDNELYFFYETKEYKISYSTNYSYGKAKETKWVYVDPQIIKNTSEDKIDSVLLEGTDQYIVYNYLRIPSMVVLGVVLGGALASGAYYGYIVYQSKSAAKKVEEELKNNQDAKK